MNKILAFLERSDKYNKKIVYILSPLLGFLEYINMRKSWKIIIEELLTKDDVVNWLDKQEFGLEKFQLRKKDLIQSGSYYDVINFSDVERTIKKEFINAFGEQIEKSCDVNIENEINLNVNVSHDSSIDRKIYEVSIRYWRYEIAMDRVKMGIKLSAIIISLGVVTTGCLLILFKYLGVI